MTLFIIHKNIVNNAKKITRFKKNPKSTRKLTQLMYTRFWTLFQGHSNVLLS